MELNLIRNTFTEKSTIGKMSVNGVFECFTLEDPVRAIKIPGRTAIPYGRYEVVITFSKRFQRNMPLLLSVPNFTAIRFHWGNDAADTEGCPLVGMDKGNNVLGRSRLAFDAFFPKIEKAIESGDRVWVTVEHAPLPEPQPKTDGFAA